MKLYENVFVARSDLPDEELENLAGKLRQIIVSGGKEVVSSKNCGVRNLVYEISNNNKGHFYITHFHADKPLLDEIDHFMKVSEDIIRHITVAIPESREDLLDILVKEKKDFE